MQEGVINEQAASSCERIRAAGRHGSLLAQRTYRSVTSWLTQSPRRPPESPSPDPQREALLATAEFLAKILDTTVKIPGTRFYLGLDPLLGLIPGIGDMLANLIGTVILILAARLQVPQIVIARMSLNLLINGTIGAIPILGDLFSVWFRSHARNAVLLREAATKPDRGNHARLAVCGRHHRRDGRASAARHYDSFVDRGEALGRNCPAEQTIV